jgi:hypothetical protein
MEKYLAQLTIPGYGEIEAPAGVPRGGEGTLSNARGVGIQIFLIVVIIASLLYIVWAGINWIRSSGDPQKIEAARMQIVYAIIGLVVAFISFGLIAVFGGIFGVNLI